MCRLKKIIKNLSEGGTVFMTQPHRDTGLLNMMENRRMIPLDLCMIFEFLFNPINEVTQYKVDQNFSECNLSNNLCIRLKLKISLY